MKKAILSIISALTCISNSYSAQAQLAIKPDIVAILKGAQDFVQNYSNPPSIAFVEWNKIRPKVNYGSAPIVSIQMALIQIPYRVFGITAQEMNQITQTKIPSGIGTKIHNNSAATFEFLKQLPPILNNLPDFVVGVCNYIKLLAKNSKNIPPEILTAVSAIETVIGAKRNFIQDFGTKLSVVMQDLYIALTVQNLAASKQSAAINDRHILYELSQVSGKMKPEFESLTSALVSVEPDFIDNVFNALKHIDFSKLNYQAIEQDVQNFNTATLKAFASA